MPSANTATKPLVETGDACAAHYERKYSPSECVGARKRVVAGDPERAHISASYVERRYLTMWLGMRRFARLTNAFSKKLANRRTT